MVYFRCTNMPELFRCSLHGCKNSVSTYSSVQFHSHVTGSRITNLLKVCRVSESWYMSSRQGRKRNIAVSGVTTDGNWRGLKILRESAKKSQAVNMQIITEWVQQEKETEEKETTGWQVQLQVLLYFENTWTYFLLSERIFDHHHSPWCYWVHQTWIRSEVIFEMPVKLVYCGWLTDQLT